MRTATALNQAPAEAGDTGDPAPRSAAPEAREGAALPLSVSLALCLVPIVGYVLFLLPFSLNVPKDDDFDAILRFLDGYLSTPADGSRFWALFAQHNEHRILFSRLLFVLLHRFFGPLDFHVLNMIGLVQLPLLACVLALCVAKRHPLRYVPIVMAPACMLLFQGQGGDSLLWPTATIANGLVIVLAALCLHLLETPGSAALAGALLAGAVCAFAQGNGMMIWPAGFMGLLLMGDRRRAFFWLANGIAATLVYFYWYSSPQHNEPMGLHATRWAEVPLYIVNFIGAAGGFSRPLPSFLIGSAVCLYVAFLTAKRYPRQNMTIYALFLFMLMTVGVNSLMRSGWGADYPLTRERYKVCSVTFLVLVGLSLWDVVKSERRRAWLAFVSVSLAALFCIWGYMDGLGSLAQTSWNQARGIVYWSIDRQNYLRGALIHPNTAHATGILERSLKRGLYSIEIEPLEEAGFAPSIEPAGARCAGDACGAPAYRTIDEFLETERYFFFQGWTFLVDAPSRGARTSLILERDGSWYVFRTDQLYRPDLDEFFGRDDLSNAGFKTLVPKRLLPPGKYDAYLYTATASMANIVAAGVSVEVK